MANGGAAFVDLAKGFSTTNLIDRIHSEIDHGPSAIRRQTSMSEQDRPPEPRTSRRMVLENAKRAGFQPGSIIDVGFAMGTEGLFDVFEGTRNLLIEPVA